MYNGVQKAAQIPELGMGETLEYLEQKYPLLAENNQKYLQLNLEVHNKVQQHVELPLQTDDEKVKIVDKDL